MSKSKLSVIGLIVASALFLVGCNAQTTSNTSVTPPTSTTPPASNTGVDFTINMNSFSFSPNTITAAPGQTINVKLVSQGGEHTFNIDALGVSSGALASGEDKVIQISIPANAAVGTTYEYYCTMPGHKDFGMVGSLQVVAN